MKINFVWNFRGLIKVPNIETLNKLRDDKNTSPQLKKELEEFYSYRAEDHMILAQEYLNRQPITYDEREQVMQRWKEQLLE